MRVRFNELLGFVHPSLSAFPELSSLILLFNTTTAAWRFNATEHQLSSTRARLIAFNLHEPSTLISRLIKIQDCRFNLGAEPFNRNLTPELTRPRAGIQSLPQETIIKAMLSRVGLNELLGFVSRCHSTFPEPSSLILSFNIITTAWRFNALLPQRSMCVPGSDHSSGIGIQA